MGCCLSILPGMALASILASCAAIPIQDRPTASPEVHGPIGIPQTEWADMKHIRYRDAGVGFSPIYPPWLMTHLSTNTKEEEEEEAAEEDSGSPYAGAHLRRCPQPEGGLASDMGVACGDS